MPLPNKSELRLAFLSHTTALLLILAIATSSYYSNAQASQAISGKYSNPEAGVEIVFPDGWSGSEISTANDITTMLHPDTSAGQGENPVALYLSIIKKSAVPEPDTKATPVGYENLDCAVVSTANMNVAGVVGLLTGSSCTDSKGVEYELESVLVNTETRWIILSLFAEEELYEAHVDARFAALDTLKIQGGTDVEGSTPEPPSAPLEMITTTESVIVDGKTISVLVNSSSSISGFDLNVESRALSFTTESKEPTAEEDAKELTIISIGRILEGPYMVTIDGQIIDEWFVDEATGEPMLWITHDGGIHDIVVNGTRVIPEFTTLGLIVVLSTVIGLIAFLRRFSIVRSFYPQAG